MTPIQRALSSLPFVAGCVTFWIISGMQVPPVPDVMLFKFSDKFMHAIAYGCLAACAAIRARDRPSKHLFIEAALLASVYGVIDEIHQSFVPGRSATVSDVLADATGALLGAWLCVKLRTLFFSDWEQRDGEHRDGEHRDGEHRDGEHRDGEHSDANQ